MAMAIGIAIDKGMITLDTFIYPSIKNIVEIRNENNLEKIKKWKIRDLLTHTTGYESQMMSERFIKDIDEIMHLTMIFLIMLEQDLLTIM